MLASITNWGKGKWRILTRANGSRRLSWFALLLAFALDIYVLNLLVDGMKNAQDTVNQPFSGVSRECASASMELLAANTTERASKITQAWFNAREHREQFSDYGRRLVPICVKIGERWVSAVSDSKLLALAQQHHQQLQQTDKIKSDIDRLKSTYSDALLEKIARQKRSDSILPVEASEIKATVTEMQAALAELQRQTAATEQAILQLPLIAAYFRYLQTLPLANEFDKADKRFERQAFWYPFKMLGAQAAFILPLLAIAIAWNARVIKKQQDIRILISSHIVLVCALPILIRLLEFIRELLPYGLLEWLLDQLNQWQLGFVWYYVLIAACIAGGLLLIFIAQHTLFSTARLRLFRLRKAQCQACGEKLLKRDQGWCEICGASQAAPCRQCGQPRRLLAFHCGHCGTPV
ncbi:hypothetical protein GJ697_06775 [Pseudoduganella sp. FT25W]|uniref:Zinc ribbon domain-containing protein n=1 Tax=Duganella alba TaxID=2666081 RepID=A0A6L5QD20_9BURK|nr:hypothetical protein [Duganella alba]MRX07529.1 hypothetical protein [Duganella alba]MRX15914.1 hypothetical protein [Duganella alba]